MSIPGYISEMLSLPLLCYGSGRAANDNQPDTLSSATALYLLVLHERREGDGACVSRITEHLKSFTEAGAAPEFDAICLWNYCPLSASVALVRTTPSVWDSLPKELKEKLTFAMRMFSYLESFATSDFNSYRTGPSLTGNYHKDWNPNYRMANVPAIVFSLYFFGCGDIAEGASRVNRMLCSFDEAEYGRTVAQLGEYGWDRAKKVWTAPAMMHEDGTCGTDAREILVHGGKTYCLDYTHSYVTKDGGDGLGVGNGDFLYKNERGYQCFSTGSYGTSAHVHSEENESPAYFALKSLWYKDILRGAE